MSLSNRSGNVPGDLILHYHLMHPGGDSAPGDPNAAFYLDGIYHLHYILRHPWRDETSYSFVHITSPDMLHWTWQKTKLQPSFTGHGMFSGTGFVATDGTPAAIYHGQASGRNYIALAKDRAISGWEKPYPVEPLMDDGSAPEMRHWDPDCFIIDDTYYAISGGQNPPLMRSKDLRNWAYIGDFLQHDMPDVAIGEDISCANFFRLGGKWMLLCISHPFGCRYYLGDWDADTEQFVPETHGRMNWRRPAQSIFDPVYRDYFAPESVETPDGRRVMWAWLCSLDDAVNDKSIQFLPRELSLAHDGTLRICPLKELESLRYDPVVMSNLTIGLTSIYDSDQTFTHLANLDGDSFELRITIDRKEARRKRFGFRIYADDNHPGLTIMVHPETGCIRVGDTEAPFAVADLPDGEDLELRVYCDKYLVELFANKQQAVVGAYMDYRSAQGLFAYSFGATTTIRSLEIWRLKATNDGLLRARENHIWEPDIR